MLFGKKARMHLIQSGFFAKQIKEETTGLETEISLDLFSTFAKRALLTKKNPFQVQKLIRLFEKKAITIKTNTLAFEGGYADPNFCNDRDAMIAEREHPLILLWKKEVSSAQELLPFLQIQKPFLILAKDFAHDSLSTLVINHIQQRIHVCAVKTNMFTISKRPKKAVVTKEKTFLLYRDNCIKEKVVSSEIVAHVIKEKTFVKRYNTIPLSTLIKALQVVFAKIAILLQTECIVD